MQATYRKISPRNLPYNDKEVLFKLYGHNVLDGDNAPPTMRVVEEIRTLNAYEKSIFEEQQLVTPEYCLQFLYKFRKTDVEIKDLKIKLKNNLIELVRRVPELRVNFVRLGYEDKMHKLVFRNRIPDIRYISLNRLSGDALDRSLSTIMQEDRNKGFDLAQDLLFRFTLVRTDEYEYAIIITEPRLLSRAFRQVYLYLIMNVAQIPEHLNFAGADEKFTEAPVSTKMKSYWRQLMRNLPACPKLPGFDKEPYSHRGANYVLTLNKEDLRKIEAISDNNRGIIVAILQTAWGILQRQVNYCRETYFCMIMNEHSLLVNDENRPTMADRSGELIPLPVRIACEDFMLIKEIVAQQLRQMLISYKVPCRKMRNFLEEIGQPRDLFPYFLYFNGFAAGKISYSRTAGSPRCELVDNIGWDSNDVNLAIHFIMDADGIKVNFKYNAYAFSGYSVEPLAKSYAICLHNMLRDWHERFDIFSRNFREDVKKWDTTFGGYIL